MSKKILAAAVAGVALSGGLALAGAGAAQAAPAAPAVQAANYVAGPYGSLTSCNTANRTYRQQGGFTYVGSCYRQSNGYYYFQYR